MLSTIPRVAGKCCHGAEEEREVANVHRLHNPQKGMSKDEYPLLRIDTLVDAAACSEMLSMLDCFSGYHQIFMNKADEEKTSFTTSFGTYCYVRMPEGLRNARCTFNRSTGDQLGRNISAYVDDVVVRSKKKEDHIQDLHETFAIMA